jgi:carboxypeptidase Q
VYDHQSAVSDVEHLADDIGGRLTGSENLVRAHVWAESTMTARGFGNVHRESYEFGKAWTRGHATARLLTQNHDELTLAGLAWGPQTPGMVTGDAMYVHARTIEEFETYIGHFGKRILFFGQTPQPGTDTAAFAARYNRAMRAIADEGATAIILTGGKPEGLGMTGGPEWRLGVVPKIPIGFMESKDYNHILRSLGHGERVTMQLDLPGTLWPKPVQAYNSIGEIRGSEWPNQVVILGAHIDSWDLGTGATDNGTGVAAVIEALRAIKAHTSEMSDVQAVLVDDLGTGRIRGFALQGFEIARPLMAMAISPLRSEYSRSALCLASLRVELSSCVEMIEIQDRVEHERVGAKRLAAVDRVVGEKYDVTFLQWYVDNNRSLRDFAAAIEQARDEQTTLIGEA